MDRFFVWIGRVNSVLLLLLLIGIGFVASWEMWRDLHRHRPEPVTVTAEAGTSEPVRLTLGRTEPIAGSDVLMVPLEAERAGGKLTSGPYDRDTHNALFLTGGDAQATWLFEGNGNLIHSLHSLQQEIDGRRTGPAAAIYIEYTATDTNGDNEIDEADTVAVALAKLDGTGRTDLLQNVKRVILWELIDERTLALIYQIDKTIWHARYRTDTFTKISEQPVIAVPERL
jgi:hypothetical protein